MDSSVQGDTAGEQGSDVGQCIFLTLVSVLVTPSSHHRFVSHRTQDASNVTTQAHVGHHCYEVSRLVMAHIDRDNDFELAQVMASARTT